MNHEEKAQMIKEVDEIRALLLHLNRPTGTGGDFARGGLNGGGAPPGKRILDLF
jgi:hypothetical protein